MFGILDTWTSSTFVRNQTGDFPKTATLVFNGTAVYVNCIVGPSTVFGVIGNVDITFSIDGVVAGTYTEQAPQQYIYRRNVFGRDGLSLGEHTLVIQNGRPNTAYDQVMIFLDSVIYTTDDSLEQATQTAPPAPTSHPNSDSGSGSQASSSTNGASRTSVIVAGVCAAISGFLAGLFAFWLASRYPLRLRSRFQTPSHIVNNNTTMTTSSPPTSTFSVPRNGIVPFNDFRPNPEARLEPKSAHSYSTPLPIVGRSGPGSEPGIAAPSAGSVLGRGNQVSTVYEDQETASGRSAGVLDIASPNGPPPSYHNDRSSN
ncbi:hypothetical protein ONZ45_g15008 [Pleurotus djamor]|nr:hypothetical protein ONZ45_g15008 [Pleurotus djamor]